MKAWAIKFQGHYPVGACAVVTAPDLETAAQILYADLDYRGLKQVIPWGSFEEIDLNAMKSTVILDGNY